MKCKIDDWNVFAQSRTTTCCQEEATYEVHDLSGKIISKCCPKHGKETELLIGAANGLVTALVSKN